MKLGWGGRAMKITSTKKLLGGGMEKNTVVFNLSMSLIVKRKLIFMESFFLF